MFLTVEHPHVDQDTRHVHTFGERFLSHNGRVRHDEERCDQHECHP